MFGKLNGLQETPLFSHITFLSRIIWAKSSSGFLVHVSTAVAKNILANKIRESAREGVAWNGQGIFSAEPKHSHKNFANEICTTAAIFRGSAWTTKNHK